METKLLEQQIAELNAKLDILTSYVEEQRKRKQAQDELKADLALIGKDAFEYAITELEEVSPYFEMEDMMHLLKKLMRNVRNLNRLFDIMESSLQFLDDAKPLSKDAFLSLLEYLDEMEKKGYFEFFREAILIIDTIVTSFTVEDVKALRENIVSILNTIKEMTQPEILKTINNALGFFHFLGEKVDEKVTIWNILKELKDPQTKRGMLFAIHFMKNMTNIGTKEK